MGWNPSPTGRGGFPCPPAFETAPYEKSYKKTAGLAGSGVFLAIQFRLGAKDSNLYKQIQSLLSCR